MSRASLNFLVDSLLLLILISLLWVSLLLRALLPPPSQSTGWSIWGLDYDAWSRIQFGMVAALGVVVCIHLILHWIWICGFVATKLSRMRRKRIIVQEGHRTLYGVVFLICILSTVLGLLLAAALGTRSPG